MSATIVVVKIGGSLLNWPDLGKRLPAYLDTLAPRRVVAIVGGGRAADFVRELDGTHGVGEETSHHLALRALDLTAHALAAIAPRFEVVDRVVELDPTWSRARIPLLAPRLLLDEVVRDDFKPLPQNWQTTSDSIAARIAEILGAEELILLKRTTIPEQIDPEEAARLGIVDPVFPRAARNLRVVKIVNLCGA